MIISCGQSKLSHLEVSHFSSNAIPIMPCSLELYNSESDALFAVAMQ